MLSDRTLREIFSAPTNQYSTSRHSVFGPQRDATNLNAHCVSPGVEEFLTTQEQARAVLAYRTDKIHTINFGCDWSLEWWETAPRPRVYPRSHIERDNHPDLEWEDGNVFAPDDTVARLGCLF